VTLRGGSEHTTQVVSQPVQPPPMDLLASLMNACAEQGDVGRAR
jgi:hypothetical protein